MQTAIEAFVENPTAETLAAAKDAWITARVDYLPTEAYRFYDGPIDNPEDGPEGQINAWPMDEAFVDYTVDAPNAGIVNNAADFPEITTDVLVSQNEQGGETNISTGWHAIEFLLWGQDQTAGSPGNRPVTDYTTGKNAERRAEYLSLSTQLLIDDLVSVRDQWDPENGAYRESFLADPDQALTNVLRGIGALSSGELAGERIAVALETKDQEDEHSCFSDNTNADIVGDIVGVRQVYLADYEGIDGTSISDLVKAVDPALDEKLRGQIENSEQLAEALPAPFEELIVGADTAPGRMALEEALTSIEDQGDSIAEVANKLGVTITLDV
jgi:putative iron-regulated protein